MSGLDREKWDDRYRRGDHLGDAPSPFLRSLAARLPRQGRALDLAGGAGRNAIWLAEHGLTVTVVDISAVGLELARTRAAARGLEVATVCRDLERDEPPAGPWDVIVSICYLNRALVPRLDRLLAPGGLLVYLQPTARNLERHARPPAGFLLAEGELGPLLPPSLEVVTLTEGWTEDGYHEARALARKPA